MGYTTEFEGRFNLDKPLTVPQFNYLNAFSEVRHVVRDAGIAVQQPDPLRIKVGLPIGIDAEFYVADDDAGVKDYNQEPVTCPGLWCQWVPTDDGEGIEWNGAEKFYEYVKWLEYIVKNFIKPWGLTLNGEVTWEGEDNKDIGKIVVKNNKVTSKKAKITYSVDYEGDEED
jgi:hypothetical protein